jgi:hypothetical protein
MVRESKYNNNSCIYKLQSKINGKCYVGSTVRFHSRVFYGHIRELNKGLHKNAYLQHHANKYGIDDLEIHILEILYRKDNESIEEFRKRILSREQYYIDTLKPRFNLSPTAGSNLGIKMSENVCRKASIRQTEIKGKSICQYGLDGGLLNTYPSIMEAVRQSGISQSRISGSVNHHKVTAGNYFWILACESIDIKLQQYNEFTRTIPVFQFDKKGNFIQKFDNQQCARKSLGLSIASNAVLNCINGRTKTVKGFIFTYSDTLSKEQVIKASTSNIGKRTNDSKIKIAERLLQRKNAENKPISQYDLKGNFIKSFNSSTEAYIETKIESINRCLSGDKASLGGFIWAYKGESITDKLFRKNNKIEYFGINPENRKEIYQFSMDGVFIRKHPSINEASRTLNISDSSIGGCISGRQMYAGDFIFTTGAMPSAELISKAITNRNHRIGNAKMISR